MDRYLGQLIEAIDYAGETGSFNKMNLICQAENVCVFGLGQYFEEAFIQQNVKKRFNVRYLCDNNKNKLKQISDNPLYKDLICIEPEELKKLKNVVVIIMLGDPRAVIKQLSELIGSVNCITYNDLALDEVMAGNCDKKWFKEQREKILEAYDLLEDEESKKTFTNVLCARIAPHLTKYSYEELCVSPQYFPADIFKPGTHESMIDCGAYNGDTVKSFIEVTKGNFDGLYAFELDKDNFNELTSNINSYDEKVRNKIFCYNLGTWDENKTIYYGKMSSADSYSIFNNKEVVEGKVVKLDDVLGDKSISIIKMDIEGAELKALQGSQNIIKLQHPKMAICVYHRIEDLWQIPIFLKAQVPQYKIYIRHHAKFWVSETVCYAKVEL